MPFGIVGWMGPGMRQVVGFGDHSMGRGTFVGELGHAIVTNGDFSAYVSYSAAMPPSSQITLGRLVINILSSSLNTTLIVDKQCSDVCCDEFSVPQNDRKSK